MSKVIKVVVSTKVIVPDNADIIRVKDDEGIEADYIRVAGRLAMPMIIWCEYVSAARVESDIKSLREAAGLKSGMGFRQLDDDFCVNNLNEPEFPTYYLEDTGESVDDEAT